MVTGFLKHSDMMKRYYHEIGEVAIHLGSSRRELQFPGEGGAPAIFGEGKTI